MKTYFLILMTFISLTSCNGQNQKNFERLSAKDFNEKINSFPSGIILDVRTPEEFTEQHIENAININWNNPRFNELVSKLDKTKNIYVYCLGGGRSKLASEKLHELGFKNIFDLDGGMLKWNAAGFSKAAESEKIIGICSQEYKEQISNATTEKVLVNFYAPWCAPCKIEMQRLKLSVENKKISPDLIFAINPFETHSEVMTFLKQNKFPFQFIEAPDITQKLNINSTPTTMFLNQGEITSLSSGLSFIGIWKAEYFL